MPRVWWVRSLGHTTVRHEANGRPKNVIIQKLSDKDTWTPHNMLYCALIYNLNINPQACPCENRDGQSLHWNDSMQWWKATGYILSHEWAVMWKIWIPCPCVRRGGSLFACTQTGAPVRWWRYLSGCLQKINLKLSVSVSVCTLWCHFDSWLEKYRNNATSHYLWPSRQAGGSSSLVSDCVSRSYEQFFSCISLFDVVL